MDFISMKPLIETPVPPKTNKKPKRHHSE
jgi:hypothetical protein